MMEIKTGGLLMREKTKRHQQLEILNCRYSLSVYEKEELQKLEAGFKGELLFDGIIEDFISGTNIIHMKDYNFYPEDIDARLMTRSKDDVAHVQLDNLVIAKDFLYTFEIKNYNFDLFYEDSKWYFENGNEFSDPLMQVARQRNMMNRLLGSFGHRVRMFNVLVFINKHQTIFNLPSKSEIIVRSNLHKKLSKAMVANHYDYSYLLGNLESRRLFDLKYQGDAIVDFRDLKKGVFCKQCGERLRRLHRYKFKCKQCVIESSVLENLNQLIIELNTLNRTWTITPSLIQQYSNGEISEYCIRSNKKKGLLDY